MSKSRPFIRSFWGLTIILVMALVVLGIANYQTNRAGFGLAYQTFLAAPATKSPLFDTALFINQTDTLDKFFTLTDITRPDLEQQIVLAYPDLSVTPASITRQGANLYVHYIDHVGNKLFPLIALDRTKLISSSTLTVHFLVNNQTTQSLTITPDQI